ncbi:hypothetical protein KVV02_008023 [Mortierella alpina]|uniref:Choline kinase n=1 Tax=Mortierella alpina TaxID=64518 RepID=A0A9P8A8T6_MORAP|nr:hypothetical protein KVV02_008023 [Mortierella alpina]
MAAIVPSLSLDTLLRQEHDDSAVAPSPEDATALEVESSWEEQPVHLPTYTPSEADRDSIRDSPPTTPVDDPIYLAGSKKHFGFSARQSVASSIFPWQKHKPAVCHQYAPHRPPLSKRSSLSGLKVLPVIRPEAVRLLEDEEIDLLKMDAQSTSSCFSSLVLFLRRLPHLCTPTQISFEFVSGCIYNKNRAGVNSCMDTESFIDFRLLTLYSLLFNPASNLKGDQLARRTLELLHLLDVEDWAEVTDHNSLDLFRISGAMTNCIFLVTGPPRVVVATAGGESEELAPVSVPRKVLLRIYGIGLESLISRDNELHWLRNLSTMDIGPSLLGIFKNGRFEQYVESTTLTKEDIRHPRTSRHIAHRMCELHNIVNVFPPPEKCIPQTQENIAKWIPLAMAAIEKICLNDPEKRAAVDAFDFEKLLVEIEEVYRELTAVHSPLVFAHNDTQYGNILRKLDDSGELVVIDFEYAGYNTRGFDIGNHFCEWTADYHSDRPSVLHPDWYPTKAEQLNFLEAYMEAEIAMCGYHLTAINLTKYAKKRRSLTSAIASGFSKVTLSALHATSAILKRSSNELQREDPKSQGASGISTMSTDSAVSTDANTTFVSTNGTGLDRIHTNQTTASEGKGNSAAENDRSLPRSRRRERGGGDGSGGVSKAEILDSMYKEVNKFALTSHIMWGLWGLIQATQSEIDFDYFEYSLQRLSEFRRRRDEFMAL